MKFVCRNNFIKGKRTRRLIQINEVVPREESQNRSENIGYST